MRFLVGFLLALLVSATAWSQFADSKIPRFTATALTGEKVSSGQLIGQPTVLIVTPSKDAAEDTRLWAQALRKNIDPKAIRVRDVLAIDLPFFMSESDAIGRAKEKIPARYFDQTWIFAEQDLERALGIPTNSRKAFVIVLDAAGQVIARVQGDPTEARIEQVQSAVWSTKP